jgi:hypothetical protein
MAHRLLTLLPEPDRKLSRLTKEKDIMKYGIAWLLGVPASLLVVWYVVSHVF